MSGKHQNNYKQIEKLLGELRMYKKYIENCQLDIDYLKEESGVKGISYDDTSTSSTNKINSIVEDVTLANIEKVEFLEREIQRHTNKVEKIESTLEELTSIQRKVIEMFYIEDKLWWQVASEVGYSEVTCRRIRSEGIKKLIVGMFGNN